jgi:hypothetical protein
LSADDRRASPPDRGCALASLRNRQNCGISKDLQARGMAAGRCAVSCCLEMPFPRIVLQRIAVPIASCANGLQAISKHADPAERTPNAACGGGACSRLLFPFVGVPVLHCTL